MAKIFLDRHPWGSDTQKKKIKFLSNIIFLSIFDFFVYIYFFHLISNLKPLLPFNHMTFFFFDPHNFGIQFQAGLGALVCRIQPTGRRLIVTVTASSILKNESTRIYNSSLMFLSSVLRVHCWTSGIKLSEATFAQRRKKKNPTHNETVCVCIDFFFGLELLMSSTLDNRLDCRVL